jgi:hypothetical protein
MLAGNQGYSIILSADFDGNNREILEVGTIYKGKPYFIAYNAQEDLYQQYLPIIEKMIDSFRFTK